MFKLYFCFRSFIIEINKQITLVMFIMLIGAFSAKESSNHQKKLTGFEQNKYRNSKYNAILQEALLSAVSNIFNLRLAFQVFSKLVSQYLNSPISLYTLLLLYMYPYYLGTYFKWPPII